MGQLALSYKLSVLDVTSLNIYEHDNPRHLAHQHWIHPSILAFYAVSLLNKFLNSTFPPSSHTISIA